MSCRAQRKNTTDIAHRARKNAPAKNMKFHAKPKSAMATTKIQSSLESQRHTAVPMAKTRPAWITCSAESLELEWFSATWSDDAIRTEALDGYSLVSLESLWSLHSAVAPAKQWTAWGRMTPSAVVRLMTLSSWQDRKQHGSTMDDHGWRPPWWSTWPGPGELGGLDDESDHGFW